MDTKDRTILKILMENARTPKTQIAKVLGITETAVRKRISKLEREKVILGYKVVINYKTAGLSASLTGVDVVPEKLWSIISKLKDVEGVKSIILTTGDHMIMLEIVAESVEELSEIHGRIEKLEGVKRICPAIVLDVLR
ncbi:MAG: transcriptional regulator [Archaeoglobus sp.]|jgi:Lrp/AsnC family transcriptional regulator for asnA, asnC and gidA|nr:MAG: transcriptional regulator [Archaeoglobus sp.]